MKKIIFIIVILAIALYAALITRDTNKINQDKLTESVQIQDRINDSLALISKHIDSLKQLESIANKKKWEKTKAGRINKKHPEWSEDDCDRIALGQIWIGMHFNMLEYERGRPDHINNSNYGSGIQRQWCWDGYNTSCFYDKNGDYLVDAYN